MSGLRIEQLQKKYTKAAIKKKEAFVLDAIDLDIQEGEFFSLLGPSGCGKTTLLKLTAGLLQPDAGEIWFRNTNLTSVSPETRRFSMVFQQSLLFPHMTIGENAAFGLKMQKVSKNERLSEAYRMLGLVGLAGYEHRYPEELSGGQQQRVALARALVAKPRVLLMDEPFSALDPNLREEMRDLLGRIQKELSVTVLFVTHDREEAFELSDRIGVMGEGRLLQVGSSRELYEHPASSAIASFLGLKNIIAGKIADGRFMSDDHVISVATNKSRKPGRSFLILRPESLQLLIEDTPPTDSIIIRGELNQVKFTHGFYTAEIQTGNHYLESILSREQAEGLKLGQKIVFHIRPEDLWFTKN